jgi:acyl-CoA synthetase (AMP-forming)/AMP-acid ligase II
MAHILADAEPRAADHRREHSGSRRGTGGSRRWLTIRPACCLDGDAPAGIIYTSGTTGTSKGAVLTHNNFAANAVNLLACWQITSRTVFLLALPLFHVHGLGNGLHCWLMSGCRMRLLERFEHQTPPSFLDFRPTLFFGVPAIYVRLLGLDSGGRRARSARSCGCSFRVRRPSPAGSRRIPGALWPHDSGALRHERDAHEHQQPL